VTGPAHRLVLTAAEWGVLARHAPGQLPPDVAPPVPSAAVPPDLSAGWRVAARGLVARGVLTPDSGDPLDLAPVPAVAANLALLSDPAVWLRVEVGLGAVGVRAVFTVGEQLGASLFTLADGAVELSMFPGERLGWELVRAVPTPAQLVEAGGRLRRALAPPAPVRLDGVLPLALLDDAPAFGGQSTSDHSLSDVDSRRLRAVREQTIGVLNGQVYGRTGEGVAVGQVVWLATVDGWVGLEPVPGNGPPLVRLTSVAREDLGTWVAPYVASVLEGEHERA
jgi:hypothetical protein